MLVTCPECGVKISDEADPCPKCGLPEAGRGSKEFNEMLVGGPDGREDWEEFKNYPPTCHKCGHKVIERVKVKKEVIGGKGGYNTIRSFKCPKCGTVLRPSNSPKETHRYYQLEKIPLGWKIVGYIVGFFFLLLFLIKVVPKLLELIK